MYCRLIAPEWLLKAQSRPKVLEGDFTEDQLRHYNQAGYNVYYLPNHPHAYEGGTVDGTHIDVFEWVFVDFDLKDKQYESKDAFISTVGECGIMPTKIVDSGNGIHVYWRVSDLDAHSYLRLQRRLVRFLRTDEATTSLFQLMRLPGYLNTKKENAFVPCEILCEDETSYTCEELDKLLPPITIEDEKTCQAHYDRIHNKDASYAELDKPQTPKFGRLLRENKEVKELWASPTDDRSMNDWRLATIMHADGFTKEEASTVLVNSAKALKRSPVHRVSYAENIINKIWTDEVKPKLMSESVEDILSSNDEESLKGTRFRCYRWFDGTEHGFRLTQVIGLCAGVGVGKTAIGLNMFMGFVKHNPNYIHIFVSLEQPAREIAGRWQKMTKHNPELHSKVHVLSNYNDDGSYRNLSLTDIQEYILKFKAETNQEVGCVCIDHIGVLRQEKSKAGEHMGLRAVCAQMKSFAVATNTLLIMQTQTSRSKAGIGDLELYKDAAFGTQDFEGYLDFFMVAWQPLKRCYDLQDCPKVTAFKFAKIRFKSDGDNIIEDQKYRMFFDTRTETLRLMTEAEMKSADFFAGTASNRRDRDKEAGGAIYQEINWVKEGDDETKTDSDRLTSRH